MNQSELREMAEARIRDAQVLIQGERWEFAYYSAGYAVECALKSCLLARMVLTGWIFLDEKGKNRDDCRTHNFTHNFGTLIRIAGLNDLLIDEQQKSAAAGGEFAANWNVVTQWEVTSRYEAKTEFEAKTLLAAITDEPFGALAWIRKYW